jgi:hypothetical protein
MNRVKRPTPVPLRCVSVLWRESSIYSGPFAHTSSFGAVLPHEPTGAGASSFAPSPQRNRPKLPRCVSRAQSRVMHREEADNGCKTIFAIDLIRTLPLSHRPPRDER